ncbi:hypothetical protein ACFQH2_11725 [Natronoarchaeum sp. GCM10025703]|uniref:hypothetical protein n=1 Tax=Natronoarchaeum sp. GCM10025703 TaxID=3252685 RepID=UPI00360EC8BE
MATTTSLSERNTQLRLVQPFLETLGWSLDRIVAEYEFADARGNRSISHSSSRRCPKSS